MSDWQPINTAPKDGTIVDLWIIDYMGEGVRLPNCRWDQLYDGDPCPWKQEYAEIRGGSFEAFNERERATHWMPPPGPPQTN